MRAHVHLLMGVIPEDNLVNRLPLKISMFQMFKLRAKLKSDFQLSSIIRKLYWRTRYFLFPKVLPDYPQKIGYGVYWQKREKKKKKKKGRKNTLDMDRFCLNLKGFS